MLYVGEPLGRGWTEGEIYPEVDIAVDPLEGTNLCATGSANSIATIAASEKGGLLNAPDIYMDKIVVGPTAAEFVNLNASVEENLNRLAEAFQRDVDELTIVVLDRERHHDLIAQIREAGARIKLITDGDLIRVLPLSITHRSRCGDGRLFSRAKKPDLETRFHDAPFLKGTLFAA
jgi:fructose-1,6-bisphosphatase/sedoheptulose 1,7-bisphosphatase-like protein